MGRLTSESSAQGTKVYSYDDAGNRTSVVVDNSTTIYYTYDSAGQLTSDGSASYQYDANGNLIKKIKGIQTTSYAYDVWGKSNATESFISIMPTAM